MLPTVWDAWSANAVVAAGFPALTIGSHPLADSRGQGDNEAMSLDDALDGIRRITAAVDVPVSADMESGYDTAATELVERVLDAGAVGINIEDTVHSEKRLRSAVEHADYIGALRSAADVAGVPLVINARTDVLLGKVDVFDDPLAEAIRRLRACEDAGARCVYPVRAPDAAAVRTLLDELGGTDQRHRPPRQRLCRRLPRRPARHGRPPGVIRSAPPDDADRIDHRSRRALDALTAASPIAR